MLKFMQKKRYCMNREAMNRIAKATWAKLNVSYFCEPHQCADSGNPFKGNINVVLLRVPQIFQKFKFQLKSLQIFIFCEIISVCLQDGIFVAQISFFVFTIATIFARNSCQQYSLMHKCNSTLNTLSLIASQNANLPLTR